MTWWQMSKKKSKKEKLRFNMEKWQGVIFFIMILFLIFLQQRGNK